jgi:dTDP-4-dehydrorhamnose reductase
MLMEKRFYKILPAPEIWGGIECSFNRVRSRYFDQLKYGNHYDRIEQDISLFAGLGIKTMRYPVIWERLQPKKDQSIDWRSTEVALTAIRNHQIHPIAGLVHHGSGPKYADITSDNFPVYLQQFAASVAKKFPWIEYYTPVNEPLTTARFCSLYGIWFPHKRNDKMFVRTFLNEMKGIVLSMKAIREINPSAKLVQTEDLAKIFSTNFLKYQADFENERRWLTFDILCGKLQPKHALWKYFLRYAASDKDLYFFIDNPCPPDIIGLDYYPTSERYLDENVENYPTEKRGHNHRHHYADVEAIRIRHQFPYGPKVLLREVWDRYGLPMAVTEVHIHCDHENQIRWFSQIWNACRELLAAGVDIKSVTTWAMLGSYGWNKLLTAPGGNYESGAFNCTDGETVVTPLAEFISKLSSNPDYQHPAALQPGWWEEESRFLFEKVVSTESMLNGDALNQACLTH